MARGKYSKRRGGSRFAAQSAEEIEQRNTRLAELDGARSKRREEAEEENNNNEAGATDKKEEQTTNALEQDAEKVGERVASLQINTETRKQREERQKAEAAAAYRKKHEAGLTEEYRRDMAKLAEVKARREAAQAKQKVEQEAEALLQAEERKKMEALMQKSKNESDSEDDDKKKKKKKSGKSSNAIPKLDKISIKKMKPAVMKEALKERGLEIQGNSKALTERLLKYEAER